MILEWLESLFTPAPKISKKMGLVYHSVALKYRYNRCKKAWAPHIEKCQNLITQQVAKLEKTDSLVILGSAHLHEIPKEILESKFKSVTLVDLVHPLEVRFWARKRPHIKLVEMDLSGILEKLATLNTPAELLKELKKTANFYFEADLIISSNLISQLHLIALGYFAKKRLFLTDSDKDHLGTAFSEHHLRSLQNCKGDVLLYGDRQTIYRDKDGKEVYRGHYPLQIKGFEFIEKWKWNIAPLGEYSKSESIEMIVESYCRTSKH